MAQVFLSYARDDLDRAKTLAAAIERAGHSVWWDGELEGGAEYGREIDEALKAADVVVVLWSKHSIGSAWVRDEAAAGRDTGRLVPVRLDECEPPLGFRQFQTIDLSRWKGGGGADLKTLASAVAAKVARGPKTPNPAVPPSVVEPESKQKVLAAVLAPLLIIGAAGGAAFWYVSIDRYKVPSIAIVGAAGAADRRASQSLARALSVDIGSLQTASTSSFALRDSDGGDTDYVVKVSAPESASADLSLLSRPDSQILWSGHFEQPAGTYESLRMQAATRLASVLSCLMEGSPASGRQLDEATLKLYLIGCEKSGDEYDEMPDPARLGQFGKVVDRSPRFAPALAQLALLEVNGGLNSAARSHLALARRLNPHLGKIYLAERNLLPRFKWRERQAILQRGLVMSPDDALLHASLGFELSQVGRMNDAVSSSAHALELDPLSPLIRANYIQHLANAGRLSQAQNELQKAEKIWPSSKMLADARYAFDLRLGDAANALRILRENQDKAVSLDSSSQAPNPGVELFLKARLKPATENIDRTVEAYMARYRKDPMEIGSMLLSLGAFGRTDQAFEVLAHEAGTGPLAESTAIFFRPYMSSIRNDRRFMALAARLGLVRYWTDTGKWPDFCLETKVGYDCKKEAAKFSPAQR